MKTHTITLTVRVSSLAGETECRRLLEGSLVDSAYSMSCDDGPETELKITAVDAGADPCRLSRKRFMGYPHIVPWARKGATV